MQLKSPYKAIDERSDTPPPHPGEILREDVLPHFHVSPKEFARHLGVPLQTLDTILSERAPITRSLARRLGSSLGQGAHYWLALQTQYDIWQGTLDTTLRRR